MADPLPSKDMQTFQQALSNSKHIIAVAGAGLSAASGIPTFRGAGGMWRKYDAMNLATPQAFAKDQSLVWQFYHMRREKALHSQPNAAHHALASFSLPAWRHQIAPDSTFTLITQNVDGLSQRALDAVINTETTGMKTEIDDSNAVKIPGVEQPIMLEMHGRLFDVTCAEDTDCGHRELDFSSPVCSALAGTEAVMEKGAPDPTIQRSDLPRCKGCGGLGRPGVVWFGEVPVHLDTIDVLLEKADMCLVVGTSSTVYPAALFAYRVKESGGKVAFFNIDRSEGDEDADWLFLGPCEETLPAALGVTQSDLPKA